MFWYFIFLLTVFYDTFHLESLEGPEHPQIPKLISIIGNFVELAPFEGKNSHALVILSNWSALAKVHYEEEVTKISQLWEIQRRLLKKEYLKYGNDPESRKFNETSNINKKKFHESFVDISEHKIASQLTHLEFELFKRLPLEEFLSLGNQENLIKIRDHSHKVIHWIVNEILSYRNPKLCARVLSKFILIGKVLLELKNFQGAWEVYMALTLPAISRLTIWDQISAKDLNFFDQIHQQLHPSAYERFKQFFFKHCTILIQGISNTIEDTNQSIIPCFSFLFKMIHDILILNATDANGHLNLEKIFRLGQLLRMLSEAQKHPYTLHFFPDVHTFLQSQLNVRPTTASQINEKSFQLQPKEETFLLDQSSNFTAKRWYLGCIKKNEAEKVLRQCLEKSFLVRLSKGNSPFRLKKAEKTYVVSTFTPGSKKIIEHKYKIMEDSLVDKVTNKSYKGITNVVHQFKVQGFVPAWNNLAKSIKLHQMLPFPEWKARQKRSHEVHSWLSLPEANFFKDEWDLLSFPWRQKVNRASGKCLNKLITLIQKYEANLKVEKDSKLKTEIKILLEQTILQIQTILDEQAPFPEETLHILAETNEPKLINHYFQVQPTIENSINAKSCQSLTALHIACQKRNFDCALELLNFGAGPNIASNQGKIPLHSLSQIIPTPEEEKSYIHLFEQLTDKSWLDLEDENGITPLQIALVNSNEIAVKFLIMKGANTQNIKDSNFMLLRSQLSNLNFQSKRDSIPFQFNPWSKFILEPIKQGEVSDNSCSTEVKLTSRQYKEHFFEQSPLNLLLCTRYGTGSMIVSINEKGDDFLYFPKVASLDELRNSLDFAFQMNFLPHNSAPVSRLIMETEQKMIPQEVAFRIFHIPRNQNHKVYHRFLSLFGERSKKGNISLKFRGVQVTLITETLKSNKNSFYFYTPSPIALIFYEGYGQIDPDELFSSSHAIILIQPVKPLDDSLEATFRIFVCYNHSLQKITLPNELGNTFLLNKDFKEILLAKLLNLYWNLTQEEIINIRNNSLLRLYDKLQTTSTTILETLSEDWTCEVNQELGKGGWGTVYRGFHCKTHQTVAIKVLQKQGMTERQLRRLYNETTILQKLKHPHVVELLECVDIPVKMCLIMEFCPNGTLEEFVHLRQDLTLRHIAYYMKQLLSAIDFIHSSGIVHRDLKPSNILMDSNYNLKIADFGFGRDVETDEDLNYSLLGTADWMAPEIAWQKRPYNYYKLDIWSLGCIAYFLVFKSRPHLVYLLQRDDSGKICNLPSTTDPQVSSFLHYVLVEDAELRPTCGMALTHPWILSVNSKMRFFISNGMICEQEVEET